jgi:hypothetical protein
MTKISTMNRAVPMDDDVDIDFFDLGASTGGSLKWAAATFGGHGCGVDMDPRKIEKLKDRGLTGIVADASKLDLPPDSVRFTVMLDFLEHLPNAATAEKVIAKAIELSSDFVLMSGPDFANEDRLRETGYKRYYADWHGHRWHHTASDLKAILSRQAGVEWSVVLTERVRDTFDRCVVPLDAPADGGPYTPERDGPKDLQDLISLKLHRVLGFVAVKPGSALSLDDVIVRGLMRPVIAAGRKLAPLLPITEQNQPESEPAPRHET